MADIKVKYPAAATALTVTNLHSLASSVTWVTGWTSGTVDNTTNVYLDYLVGATFTTHASNRQAGVITMYAYAPLDGTTTWPDLFSAGTEGTEGTLTFNSAEARDSGVRFVAACPVNNTASAVFTIPPTGLKDIFGGALPPKFALIVVSSASTTTTTGLAAAGSAVYITPITMQTV